MGDPDLVLFPHVWNHLANEVDIVFWSISPTLLLFPFLRARLLRAVSGASLQSAFSHRCPAQLINSSQQKSSVITARGADGCPAGLGAHSFPAGGRHQPGVSIGPSFHREVTAAGNTGWLHRGFFF